MPVRRRHHRAENLSEASRLIIEDGLIGGRATYADIVDKVKEATGETIAASSVARYHAAKVRPREDALRNARLMAHEMAEWMGDLSEPELRRAIELRTAKELYPMLEELAKQSPKDAAGFYSQLEGRRIDEQRLAQRNQDLELKSKRLELQRQFFAEKLKEIVRRAESADKPKDGRAPTKEELRQALRDLHGLARDATAAPAEPAKESA